MRKTLIAIRKLRVTSALISASFVLLAQSNAWAQNYNCRPDGFGGYDCRQRGPKLERFPSAIDSYNESFERAREQALQEQLSTQRARQEQEKAVMNHPLNIWLQRQGAAIGEPGFRGWTVIKTQILFDQKILLVFHQGTSCDSVTDQNCTAVHYRGDQAILREKEYCAGSLREIRRLGFELQDGFVDNRLIAKKAISYTEAECNMQGLK